MTVYRKINGVYFVRVPPAVDFYTINSGKERTTKQMLQSQSQSSHSVIKAQTILRKQTWQIIFHRHSMGC